MSKAVHSPTARLLQSSRLFSLPRPLPQPQLEGVASTGVYRASDTATLPYPTHQAIATPASSLHRGDWGLKRPLPAKRTQNTSTPHIRVQAQDTFEHITDFASAADHTQTAAKWREMGVPMVARQAGRSTTGNESRRAESVFESHLDNTDPDALAEVQQTGRRKGRHHQQVEVKARQRWKYGGPWIAGMQEGEFAQYLVNKIAGRRDEWREFLRSRELDTQLRRAQERAREEGDALTSQDLQRLRTELRPSDARLTKLEKALREDHAEYKLSSRLTSLLSDFLDLPATSTQQSSVNALPSVKTHDLMNALTYMMAEDGPPSTHPSAGLSHLRSGAVMHNHPLWGPQKHAPPIEGRVLRPRTSSAGVTAYRAKVGVGGIVAEDPQSGTNSPPSRNPSEADRMAQVLDPDLKGGNKLWVHPESAYVDDKGQIRLSFSRADEEALAVKKGEVEGILEAKRGTRGSGGSAFAAMPVDTQPRPRMQGFDESLRRQGLGRKEMDGEKAASWMREEFGRQTGR